MMTTAAGNVGGTAGRDEDMTSMGGDMDNDVAGNDVADDVASDSGGASGGVLAVGPGGVLGSGVAYEVDHIDDSNGVAWSVVLKGRARELNTVEEMAHPMSNTKIVAENLDFFYGEFHALHQVNLGFEEKQVTALIGPSGCGKSTFLRCINRMNDLIPGTRVVGSLTLDGEDILSPGVDVVALRRRIGMVFQKPNPFPKTVYENVAYGLRVNGVRDKLVLDQCVATSLRGSALWAEAKRS